MSRPKSWCVLYVEDEEDDVLLMQLAFARAGVTHPLQVARDGQEAIDYLAGNSPFADREAHPFPGLVLLDLHLPRKSGFEVLQWVRAQFQPGTIVVVLTSSSNLRDVQRAYELGANGYVIKAAGIDKLVSLVRSVAAYWLHHNQSPPPARTSPPAG